MNYLKRILRTLFMGMGFLFIALLAGCGGGDNGRDPILGLPAADLLSIAVTPATGSIPINGTQQFLATATFADGSSRNVTSGASWTSGTSSVATINGASGLATGIAAGTSVITASFGGKSGTASLTVTPATLVSMTLTPAAPSIAAGARQQFTAMGTFSDGTTRDITAIATFTSATTTVATIAAGGLATGVRAGTSVITAASGTRSATALLTVTPATLVSLSIAPTNPTMAVGTTRQLSVNATYSDASTVDVTANTAFTSVAPTIATVGPTTGLVTAVSVGSSLITGTFGGQSVSTTATVTAASLTSISVTPATATVAIAGTQKYVATGTFSNGTTADISNTVAWTSTNTTVATVLPTGVATGQTAGTASIRATSGALSGAATIVVTAVPPPPPSTTVALGAATSFAVLAGNSITNNSGGLTFVTGDVGSPSQTTPPVVAPGSTNYSSGAILANALYDLGVAIVDANSRTCTVSSAAGIDLGGLTLSPGVYCYAGAISITGTLNLNGPGLYIFRTSSTLNSTANSIVALIGGATADNVFWVPVGATTLGANSTFKGSVLAQSSAITMGDTATLINGRVLSGSAVTLRNNVISR